MSALLEGTLTTCPKVINLHNSKEGDAENSYSIRNEIRQLLAALIIYQQSVMNWIILILAGLMEVCFTFCLGKTKSATGNELYLWWVGFIVALTLSMILMAKAARTLPLGTVYPVWTGIGAVGAVVVGIIFFHEPANFWRLFFITTLIISIIGLKMV